MKNFTKRKALFFLTAVFLISTLMLTGCDYVNIAVLNSEYNGVEETGRKSLYWSGLSKSGIEIKEDGTKDITFLIEMDEGELTLTLSDSNGEEIYSLSREGRCSEAVVYTVEESGQYSITETGSKFCGSYKISWGNVEEETGKK